MVKVDKKVNKIVDKVDKNLDKSELLDIKQFNQEAETIIMKALNEGKGFTETLNKIDYMYVNESLKQKKWINRSVMERRDRIRYTEQQK